MRRIDATVRNEKVNIVLNDQTFMNSTNYRKMDEIDD
jgi:hypothetical protein